MVTTRRLSSGVTGGASVVALIKWQLEKIMK
jgi:hypothetical protein